MLGVLYQEQDREGYSFTLSHNSTGHHFPLDCALGGKDAGLFLFEALGQSPAMGIRQALNVC